MRRLIAVAGAGGLLALTGAAPVAAGTTAAEGDVDVVNTETVQVYLSADGEIETRRVYEQLVLTGEGTVEVRNPVEPDGLRNLDGFGGFDVDRGVQVSEVDVDGVTRTRTVSDYDGDLPLDVDVTYRLDGEEVEPGDVVGESGRLEVDFEVENVTGQEQEVTVTDGRGGTTTTLAEVPIPMVGSVTTTAPEGFTNVTSEEANMAGDGRGGTKLSFTMTLFPPIGSTTATFGYAADIEDGVVPRVDITALPVNPLQSPSFKKAAGSYGDGASTGEELAAGATEIDGHLLEMRDGAADLLAGLIQLHEGSQELQAGLDGKAAPGAEKLAGGASDLNDGLGQIDDGVGALRDGLGKLDDGAGQLADGAGDAAAGSRRLADGAGQLDKGLGQLGSGTGDLSAGVDQLAAGQKALAGGLKDLYEAVDSLPEDVQARLQTNQRYQELVGGLSAMLAGLGNTGQQTTLIGGVDAVRSGLQAAVPGIDLMLGGVACADTVLGAVVNGHAPVAPGAHPCFPQGFPGLPALDPTSPLDAGRAQVLGAVRAGLTGDLADGLRTLQAGLTSTDPARPGAIVALARVECGLDNSSLPVCDSSKPGIRQGLQLVSDGVPALVATLTGMLRQELVAGIGIPTEGCDPTQTLRCAAAALAAGGTELSEGVDRLVSGVMKLQTGGAQLAAGSGELSDGLGQLDDGADRLAAGTGDARSGAGRLADGSSRAFEGSSLLSDGAAELARGLIDAAEGSGLLADGLGRASEGAPKLVDGAGRLSKEGTKVIAGKGAETAQDYGTLAAVLTAGAQRAEAERMAYGAPEGARGLTAYTYVIKGEDGEGGRNLARGIAAVGLLGAGLGAAAWRRRVL